jgi:hypothetical protein
MALKADFRAELMRKVRWELDSGGPMGYWV